MVCILKHYFTEQTPTRQKTISLEYCIYLGIAVLEKVWTNREKLKAANLIWLCLTHYLKKLNPKSNTGTCLAPNSVKVHTMYACFQVHLWSHWDLSYRRGQICIAVLCCARTGPETPRKDKQVFWRVCMKPLLWLKKFFPPPGFFFQCLQLN